MTLTPQDLWTLRNIAIRTIKEVHEVLAEAARRPKTAATTASIAPTAMRTEPQLTAARPEATSTAKRLTYTIKDAGGALGLSRSTIYKLIAEGELATLRIGSRRLISAAALEAFLTRAKA